MDLILTLTPAAAPDPFAALAHPPTAATLVELRADLLPGLDLRRAVRECPLPLLVTLRSTAEGGRGPDDPFLRRGVLTAARDAGAALLDLEAARDAHLLDELGLEPERVVLSWHDPVGTPADLEARVERLLAAPVRWVKAVPTALRLADLERVLALHGAGNPGRAERRRLITFAMGAVGIPSRYLAPLLGPPLAFAAWNPGAAAAPGQLTAEQLLAVAGHLSGPPQRLFGVVGADTSRSLSPAMHGAGYRAAGLHHLLLPFSVPDPTELGRLIAPPGRGLPGRLGLTLAGLAVTSPYKGDAARMATRRSPRAESAQSANTLLFRDGQILADTTDGDGVVAALKGAGVDPCGLTALVQGTGGAGRAAALGLHLAGATVMLRGRDEALTRATAARLGVEACAPGSAPLGVALLVNATPLGSAVGDPSPFSADELAPARAVVDLTYADQPSALARLAGELSVPLVDGRAVLLHQGLAQFAAFTARVPPRDAMRAALG